MGQVDVGRVDEQADDSLMRLSELLGNSVVKVEVGGSELRFTYALKERTIAGQKKWDTESVIEALARMIVSWDLETDTGKPMPATLPNLEKLPGPVLDKMWRAILTDDLGEVESNSHAG